MNGDHQSVLRKSLSVRSLWCGTWKTLSVCALSIGLAAALGAPAANAATLIGTSTVQTGKDNDSAGTAEAFQATASTSGTIGQLVVYLDSTNAATSVVVGLFSDSGGHPGTLLTQAKITAPAKGAWNTVTVPGVTITSGTAYWFAILSPSGAGVVQFRDKLGGGHSETSSATNLSALPTAWTTGVAYPDGPLSIYATSATSTTPILTTAPTSLSFSGVAGGTNPAAASLSITNTGGGTLSFTSVSNQTWLTAAPASGTAPATETIGVTISGLTAGTYTGQVTISAAGATGSPAAIPVTLTVTPAAPVLSVAPASLSFTATTGGANPATSSLNITNTGGGTLSFTSASNQTWLTATPASGTAPSTETVGVNISGLAAGTYTGKVTITAAGASGSPATIPVTLTVNNATGISADWPMVGQNVSRTSFATNDNVINKTNVATLGLLWSATLDGKVSAPRLTNHRRTPVSASNA